MRAIGLLGIVTEDPKTVEMVMVKPKKTNLNMEQPIKSTLTIADQVRLSANSAENGEIHLYLTPNGNASAIGNSARECYRRFDGNADAIMVIAQTLVSIDEEFGADPGTAIDLCFPVDDDLLAEEDGRMEQELRERIDSEVRADVAKLQIRMRELERQNDELRRERADKEVIVALQRQLMAVQLHAESNLSVASKPAARIPPPGTQDIQLSQEWHVKGALFKDLLPATSNGDSITKPTLKKEPIEQLFERLDVIKEWERQRAPEEDYAGRGIDHEDYGKR